MTDLEEEFRALDWLDAPDLWPEAERRQPGAARPPRRPSRLLAAVVALVVATLGIGFAVRMLSGGTARRTPQPATPVPRGAIAFVRGSGPEIGAGEIYLMEHDGFGVRALTNLGPEGLVAAGPAWSPDGTKIAFALGRAGTYGGDRGIYVMNADGTGLTQLTEGLHAAFPVWSPDGSRIVFTRNSRSLLVMSADGSGLHELRLDGEAYPPYQSPAWSPDGTRIAFQASPSQGADTNSVYVTNIDGTHTSRLTQGLSDGSPAWSPDGIMLAYAGPDGIYLLDVQAGSDRRLTDCRFREDCGFDFEPSWSPDGSRIAFSRQDGGGNSIQIFVVNADGTGLQQLTDGPEWNRDPSWNPVPQTGESPSPTSGVTPCTQATASGDFDGDGMVDEATVNAVVPADVSCKREGDVYARMELQQIEIGFGSGQTVDQALTDCQPCLTGSLKFAATDLDGDGRDELAIDVGPGAAIDYVEFYRVDPSGIRPLVVSEPGDPPYVEPGPAILGGGFDSGLWSPIECRVTPAGTRELVSVHAENITGPITGPWKVHATTMFLEGDRLVVTSTADVVSDNFRRTSDVFQDGCS